jgi:NAD(P)-dependent dehydrogenase (short-subunit alcohol dehydrogenase family)
MTTSDTSGGGTHALVVGGSGMLAGLCRALAADGWLVTVVGRDIGKLAEATADNDRLVPLSVDYEELDAFAAALEAAVAARGPIMLAVCWIRSWAPEALTATASFVAPDGRLFHVWGTQVGDDSAAAIDALERSEQLRYRQVQLGAVVDGANRRWLTNDEISRGVYAAVVADRRSHLVGNGTSAQDARAMRRGTS